MFHQEMDQWLFIFHNTFHDKFNKCTIKNEIKDIQSGEIAITISEKQTFLFICQLYAVSILCKHGCFAYSRIITHIDWIT